MKNILFVCTGNTCRSPMAEALLKNKLNTVTVRSAGIYAGHGQPASHGTVKSLGKRGISTNHQSQPVTPQLLEWSDLILTMTNQHKQALAMQFPEAEDKLYTFKEFVLDDYESQWQQLKEAYTRLETKRANLLNEPGLSPQALENRLQTELKEDITEIQMLEQTLPNIDISDPFGGDLSIYLETLEEIEKNIELLCEKLDNKE